MTLGSLQGFLPGPSREAGFPFLLRFVIDY